MAYTAPTDDILYNDDGCMYGFEASGTVTKGQVVQGVTKATSGQPFCVETYTTQPPSSSALCVAIYTATTGKDVAVAGPGCIVRCIVANDSQCVAGDTLWPSGSEGKVCNYFTIGDTNVPCGIALETQASAEGTVRMLVTGN